MKHKQIKTTIHEIVDYWFSRVDESTLSVDASEAHERCWRCGCNKTLERCHIIPDSLGGEDTASNLVLLCHRCHLDNPNVADEDIMWDWLKAYKEPFYDTYWLKRDMKEYEFIYRTSLIKELKSRNISVMEFFKEADDIFEKTTYHYGQPYYNSATMAGVFRMLIKRFDNKNFINDHKDLNL